MCALHVRCIGCAGNREGACWLAQGQATACIRKRPLTLALAPAADCCIRFRPLPQPVMLFCPAKLPAVSRYTLERGLVSLAAVQRPLLLSRPAAAVGFAFTADGTPLIHSSSVAAFSTPAGHCGCRLSTPLVCTRLCGLQSLPPVQAIVVVGFPATPLLTTRMRVCISAAHSRADLDYALEVFKALLDRWAGQPCPS